MTTDSIDQKRSRRSIRLQGYDYSQAGAYFFTVCTRCRECIFGDVVTGQMQPNDMGRIVQSVWNSLPRVYDGIELDTFVVMPNHVHGIIIIRSAVGAIHESPLQMERATPRPIVHRRRMLVSKIIGRFKMVSAKQVNILRKSSGTALWQRNYYEHVVRDEVSLTRIRQYIVDNPAQWEFDEENPAVIASGCRGDS
jgi:putative transposase